MRRPSTMLELTAWHRAYLAGEEPPYHENQVNCGWYKTKEVKGGPWVPARIYISREICPESGELLGPEIFRCDVNGIDKDPYSQWTYLRPISLDDYKALIQRQIDIPAMQTTNQKIDLSKEPILP